MNKHLGVQELSAGELNAVSGGDRLGNFEIQTLMSSYNQASSLASSVMRRYQQTQSSIINKIG